MTHEDKIIEEFVENFNNHLANGYDVFAKDELRRFLTTHRAQVLEEEQKRCVNVITDKVLDLRDENGTPLPREIKLNAVLEALKHPTN